MFKKTELYNPLNILFVIFLFFLGIITSIYKGYGDDTDSHALILSFITMIENGQYSPSRYYGHPFAELFYGFFGYYFGSFTSSLLSYIFFLLSIIILYLCFFRNEIQLNYLFLFILICLTNPVLYLDNTNPSDATLSLFLFSVGTYLLYKKYNIYAAIFFGLAIATRANYALFIYGLIFYEFLINKKNQSDIIKIFIFTSLVGGLFYFPILIQNKFSLAFISNSGGPSIELKSLLPRFIYKTFISYGIFTFPALIYFYILNKKKFNAVALKNKVLSILILLNLLIFIFIPSKTSIISLAIICSYLIIFKVINKRSILVLLICLNFIYYFFSYQIFDFKYKYNGPCDPIEAIGADLNIKLNKGYFFLRTEKLRSRVICQSKHFKGKSFKYLKGQKIK